MYPITIFFQHYFLCDVCNINLVLVGVMKTDVNENKDAKSTMVTGTMRKQYLENLLQF